MTSASWGRSKRLAGRRSFEQLFRRGKSLSEGWLSVSYLPNHTKQSRLGCAINRRVAGGAVERNRLKRWVREAFRNNAARIPEGFDLAVRARSFPEELTYWLVEERLLSLCGKIKSFND